MGKIRRTLVDWLTRKTRITLAHLLIGVAIVGVIAAFLLDLFIGHPPVHPSRRAICADHLKQIWKAMVSYAEDNEGRLPPIDDIKNNFIFEGHTLYPRYIKEIDLLACPSDPDFVHKKNFRLTSTTEYKGFDIGDPHADCITNMSYCYLGWLIMTDEEAKAFFEAYDKLSPEDYDKDIIVPEGKGNGGGHIIHRLSLDVDRFLAPELNEILQGPVTATSLVPIMWDQISTAITEFGHVPAGCNVLYLDGHVVFHGYDRDSTKPPVSPWMAALLGGRKRVSIPDCDEGNRQ